MPTRIRAHPVGYPVKPPLELAELVATVCSEAEADGKIATHKGLADAHHIKTPEATGNYILTKLQKHIGVWWFNNHWLPAGMLPIVVAGSGVVGWADAYIQPSTGATSLSYSYAYKTAYGLTLGYNWDKGRSFSIQINPATITLQIFHIVSGSVISVTAIGNVGPHIGFKLDGANVYGTVADGVTEATLLLETLTAVVERTLTVELIPTVEARFWVDGVDKGALTTNLPTGTSGASTLLYASAYNAEAVNKYFYLRDVRIFQGE